jgi:hypothetical protein
VVNAAMPFTLQAGETSTEPVEISDAELAVIASGDWFEVSGAAEPETNLTKMTVDELKAFAEANEIDLGDATKKADILSAIELALEDK